MVRKACVDGLFGGDRPVGFRKEGGGVFSWGGTRTGTAVVLQMAWCLPMRVFASRVLLETAEEVRGKVLKHRAIEVMVLWHALDDHSARVHERTEQRTVSFGAAGHEVGMLESLNARVLGGPEVERLG